MQLQPKRILLKISGEALSSEKGVAYDKSILLQVAGQIKTAKEQGAQIALVVGGGNFWRGRQNLDINRSASDYMGMLATIMNAVCLRETLNSIGVPAVADPFDVQLTGVPYVLVDGVYNINYIQKIELPFASVSAEMQYLRGSIQNNTIELEIFAVGSEDLLSMPVLISVNGTEKK